MYVLGSPVVSVCERDKHELRCAAKLVLDPLRQIDVHPAKRRSALGLETSLATDY